MVLPLQTWNPSSVNGGPDLVFASDGTSPLPPPSCPSSSPGQSSVLDPHYHQPRSLYGFTSADPNYTHRIDSPIPTSIGKVPLENDNNASNNHLMPSLDGKARHSHQQLGYSADRDDTQSQRNKAASSAVRREQRRQGGSDGAGKFLSIYDSVIYLYYRRTSVPRMSRRQRWCRSPPKSTSFIAQAASFRLSFHPSITSLLSAI